MKTLLKNTSAIIALMASVYATAQEDAVFMDRVLVIVNEDVITQSEFDYRLATIKSEFDESTPEPPNLNTQLLESMVRDRLQVQEAKRRGIEIGDEELGAAIERFAAQQNITVEQLQAALRAEGKPFDKFKESVRDSITISRFTDFYARTRVRVPAYEIDGHIEATGMDDDTAEYNIARIQIKNTEENIELAQKVINDIEGGLSFQQAVLTYSEATDAQEGGEIGWRQAKDLPEIWQGPVRGLDIGQVSPVISSENALHIIKLLDRKGGTKKTEIVQTQVSHILIKAESKVAKSRASKRLLDLRKRIEDGEDFDDLARIYSDDTGSAATGGSLGWVSPGEMVQPFEEAFNQIALNKISDPIDTQFGMHILKVEDRRKKNVTEQVMRSQAENQLRSQRAQREFGQWVRELLEGAYVEHVSAPSDPTLKKPLAKKDKPLL